MTAPVTIRDVMTDPALFGGQFGGDSFAAWRALLAAFYGLELSDDDEIATLEAITGRTGPFLGAFAALWLVIGRRGGKSQIAALVALFQAVFHDYRDRLAPGEVATVLCIAADRAQARTVMRYIQGMAAHPMIAPMVKRQTETTIEFTNRSAIEIGTASFRSVRGYTLSAVVADEIAFWHSDGANPDREIIQAVRPALTTLDGKLIAMSSPYARRGVLWEQFKRHYGTDSDRILVARAPSRTMNPTLSQAVVDDAMRDDPEAAQAEFMAQFRSDIAAFLDPALVEDATRPKPLELLPASRESYFAFVDPAGGGQDEFTLAVGHLDGQTVVCDLVRGERGSPAEIASGYAKIMSRYDITTCHGDRYAGRWPADEFRRWGITYQASELDRSGLYLEFLARLNSGTVELPPCPILKRQFAALERRTSRAGRDSIDHPPGGHDDRSNAVAGLVTVALHKPQKAFFTKVRVGAL